MPAFPQRATSTARIAVPSRAATRAKPKPILAEVHLSDDEICRRLRAGDVRAADLVYERVVKLVKALLWQLLGPGPDREDLEQQALERIISTISTGAYMRDCSLASWAAVITQHLAFDVMRRRSRDRQFFDREVSTELVELVADGQRSAEYFIEMQWRADRLRLSLAELPKAHAEAFILHDVLEHTLPELARLTGVTVAAAQSRLSRGRRRLLRMIARQKRFARNG